MEEKEIIKGQKLNIKPFCIALIMIGLLIAIVVISIECSSGFYYEQSDDLHYFWFSIVPYFGSMTFLPLFVVSLIIYFMYNKIEINVTTKRVYGIAPFNKRVDLPLDMISAVSTCIFKGIAVSTSSGVIRFRFIKNNFEIHSEISKLLNNRQDTNGFKKPSNTSAADEIKKYKELLDNGAITQEEYDKKKKELLK